jgi:ABC-2 type transport system ATP-binding protein
VQYLAVVEAEPPHRLTGLRGLPVGSRVHDPRVADPPVRTQGEVPAEVADIAEQAFAELGLTALLLAGGDAHTPVWVLARGWADLDRGEPLDPGHRFPVPGATALVTATAVLELVGDGRISLDGRANDQLGSIRLADDTITVRDLLSHTAGVDDPTEMYADAAGQGLVARPLVVRAGRGDLPLAARVHRLLQGNQTLMIEVDQLVKRFGAVTAVDGLTFTVRPGHVTGFLGPNGAGKTTTMRVILGLDAPTSGSTRVNQRSYADLVRPLHQVGALLDATALHPGRTAAAHLTSIAQSNGIDRRRVTEMLQLTGLEAVANRRLRGFSLGMKQRLGIAVALLGDPPVLMFDEPVNGLDTEGIAWIRQFFKALAADGRTVLVSSHLMSEMAQTADRLIVIGRGRLIADTTTAQLIESSTRRGRPGPLPARRRARRPHDRPRRDRDPGGRRRAPVTGLDASAIGDLAAEHGIAVHALIPRTASLEEAYLDLTGESVDFRAASPSPSLGPDPKAPEGVPAR